MPPRLENRPPPTQETTTTNALTSLQIERNFLNPTIDQSPLLDMNGIQKLNLTDTIHVAGRINLPIEVIT